MKAFLAVVLISLFVVESGAMAKKKEKEESSEPIFFYEQDSTLLTTFVQVVIRSGSLEDPPGKTGIANLMGDMLLRGTQKRSRSKFQSEVERLGGALNVRTQHDLIVVGGRVIRENIVPFLELLTDALTKPAFDAKEFESLKRETLAEIAFTKNSNNRLGGLALRKVLFADSLLQIPTSGTLSTVKAIQRDDVIQAYNNSFSRGNMVFAVATSLPEAEIKKPLVALWRTFPDGARRSHKSIEPKVPMKGSVIVVHKPDTATGAIAMAQAGMTAQDPERYPLQVANFSFGAEPLVSRLFKIIRSELGYTYAIGSTYNAMGSLTAQKGLFFISSTPSVEFTSKTLFKTLELWREFMVGGLKKEELSLAKESLVNSYPFEFDSPEKRLWKKLYGYLYDVPVLSPEEFAKTIGDIDNSKIQKSLTSHHTADNWAIAIVADKNVIEKQLEAEQITLPADQRLKISKVITPDEIIN